MSDVIRKSSGYSDDAFAPDLRSMVREAKRWIPEGVDTLVGTGLSGALVVPHLGRRLGMSWGIMRKPEELEGSVSHASSYYEGSMGRRWALVDDFVSVGHTVQRVWNQAHKVFNTSGWSPWETEFVGVFQYSRTRAGRRWESRAYLLDSALYDIQDPATLHPPANP